MSYRLKQLFIRLVNWLASRYATEIVWSFNEEEAEGQIQVIRSSYGAYLNFPELFGPSNSVALVDLYYRSENGQNMRSDRPYVIKIWEAANLDGNALYEVEYYPQVELVTEE